MSPADHSTGGGSPSWWATWRRCSQLPTPSAGSAWRPHPVLGQSTRERNIHRLHRRLAEQTGAPHRDDSRQPRLPVPVERLRPRCPPRHGGRQGVAGRGRPLHHGCANRRTLGMGEEEAGTGAKAAEHRPPPAAGLPALEQVPAVPRRPRPGVFAPGLGGDPGEPRAQRGPARTPGGERIRYLELACRMSDLIIVDEADRVAPGTARHRVRAVRHADREVPRVLARRSPRPHRHRAVPPGTAPALGAGDRQLCNAVSTVSGAADRLYGLLTKNQSLRRLGDRRLLQPLHAAPMAAERTGSRRSGKAERERDKGNGDSIDEAALGVIIAERDRISADPQHRPGQPAPSPATATRPRMAGT